MSAVPALCLSPDGWHLLSGGRDKVVCVWDIRNGSRVATLPVYEALEGTMHSAGGREGMLQGRGLGELRAQEWTVPNEREERRERVG